MPFLTGVGAGVGGCEGAAIALTDVKVQFNVDRRKQR